MSETWDLVGGPEEGNVSRTSSLDSTLGRNEESTYLVPKNLSEWQTQGGLQQEQGQTQLQQTATAGPIAYSFVLARQQEQPQQEQGQLQQDGDDMHVDWLETDKDYGKWQKKFREARQYYNKNKDGPFNAEMIEAAKEASFRSVETGIPRNRTNAANNSGRRPEWADVVLAWNDWHQKGGEVPFDHRRVLDDRPGGGGSRRTKKRKGVAVVEGEYPAVQVDELRRIVAAQEVGLKQNITFSRTSPYVPTDVLETFTKEILQDLPTPETLSGSRNLLDEYYDAWIMKDKRERRMQIARVTAEMTEVYGKEQTLRVLQVYLGCYDAPGEEGGGGGASELEVFRSVSELFRGDGGGWPPRPG